VQDVKARALLVSTSFAVIAAIAVIGCCPPDLAIGDRTVEKLAIPSAQYPLAGFWKWKDNSQDDFGVAIAPARNGFYSISFCGLAGDFKPGQWNPNSKIYGDSDYRVIDLNTIDAKDYRGIFRRLYPFESRTSTRPVAPVNQTFFNH